MIIHINYFPAVMLIIMTSQRWFAENKAKNITSDKEQCYSGYADNSPGNLG